jgi:excisionase family DNA binding protein
MNDDQLLLTVPETAKLLRISRNLAYELVARGELPAVRLGRVIRIPRAALNDWVKESAGGHVA